MKLSICFLSVHFVFSGAMYHPAIRPYDPTGLVVVPSPPATVGYYNDDAIPYFPYMTPTYDETFNSSNNQDLEEFNADDQNNNDLDAVPPYNFNSIMIDSIPDDPDYNEGVATSESQVYEALYGLPEPPDSNSQNLEALYGVAPDDIILESSIPDNSNYYEIVN